MGFNTKKVVCVFKKESDKERELIYIAKDLDDALDYLDGCIRKEMSIRSYIEWYTSIYGDGITIYHKAGKGTYDYNISYTYDEDYAELISQKEL